MKRISLHAGFTLVELIVVIILLGVLAAGSAFFIAQPFEIYQDTERRHELTENAELSIRRMSRDISRALPNSLRLYCTDSSGSESACNDSDVTISRLELINVVDIVRYRDESGEGFDVDDNILSFTGTDDSFNTLGTLNNFADGNLPANHRLVIYNTSNAIYADAEANSSNSIITPDSTTISLTTVSPSTGSASDEHQIRLSAPHQFSLQSPTQRLFVIDSTITYICDESSGILIRYTGNDYKGSITSVNLANPSLTTLFLSQCQFSYNPGSNSRSGLISIDLTFSLGNENVSLLHQVHVNNAP